MNYPTSDDPRIQFLAEMVLKQISEAQVEFSIEGTDLFPQEVAGHFGCLNLLLYETQEVFENIMQQKFTASDFQSLGLKFENSDKTFDGLKKIAEKRKFSILYAEDAEAYFNCVPYFEENIMSFAVLAHFTHYTVEEILNLYLKNKNLLVNGKIPLDDIYNKWKKAVENNKIILEEKAKIQKKNKEMKG